MAYEIMARNWSEKNLNSGKITATLNRAGQIIQIKSIDQRSRLKPLRRRFRTTENMEKENTQDAVKTEEEITHGDRQDQEIATRDSRLRAATLGSWPSLLVSVSRVRRKDAPGS